MKSLAILGALLTMGILTAWYQGGSVDKSTRPSRNSFLFCSTNFDPATLSKGKAPIFKGLGDLHFAVSTKNKKAQQYFNQGLTLLYAFNHNEAGRSFKASIELDSTLAMGYWGMAMVLGPNYNAALNPSSLEEINAVLEKAVLFSGRSTEKEQSLINALALRFPKAEVSDMSVYHSAYASAMAKAYAKFPDDAEVTALYADAMMNEHPWNFWLKDGSPQPWTSAVQSLLETGLEKFPNHPGLNHSYIHAMEASPFAAKALPSSDKLRYLLPAAGHLVHMPAHIYIRTGLYHKGVVVTEEAGLADSSYVTQCKVQGTYPLLYYPHNIHFLAACAFMEGNSEKAIRTAWQVSALADKRFLYEMATVQHYYIIPFYTLVHLAKWDSILKLEMPAAELKYPKAIWHYARGMAWMAKGDAANAQQELRRLKLIGTDGTLKSQLIWESNSVLDLIRIATNILEAEILASEGKFNQSIQLLETAKQIEDGLNYTEPPDWFFSTRHTLGHILNKAGRFQEAEIVYLEDLRNFPENGWALAGLQNSLNGQGKTEEAAKVKSRFLKAWQWSDIKINSSRLH